jgi:hypothetical protein
MLFFGCEKGNPPTFPVAGTITMKKKPVEGATIILVPTSKDQEPASATSDASGKFSFSTYVANDGVRPGTYGVKLFKYDAVPSPPANPKTEEEYSPDTAIPPPPKNHLPKKYDSEATSGISLSVEAKPATLEIEIP